MKRLISRLTGVVLCCALTAPLAAQDAPDGGVLYQRHCASCHDAGAARAPERRAIAEFVTGARFTDALSTAPSAQAMCAASSGDFANPLSALLWTGYETVNQVPARGGSIDGPGPAIGGGMIFFNSGYHTAGGVPGNVLLAYSVDGR